MLDRLEEEQPVRALHDAESASAREAAAGAEQAEPPRDEGDDGERQRGEREPPERERLGAELDRRRRARR